MRKLSLYIYVCRYDLYKQMFAVKTTFQRSYSFTELVECVERQKECQCPDEKIIYTIALQV